MASLCELGAYHEPPSERKLETKKYGDIALTLSPSQHRVLNRILQIAEKERDRNQLIPIYVSADTGAGKSHLALQAAAVISHQFSIRLNKLHSVYIAPTKMLASQASERSLKLLKILEKELSEVIELRGDLKRHEKEERIDRAFSKLREGFRIVLTNPQMLSSLVVRRSGGDRTLPFNLAAGLSEVDLYIIDEPHFYTGKSLVRLLMLLLRVGEWKKVASVTGPTFLLFISATMDPEAIDRSLRDLQEVLGVRVLCEDVPIDDRNLILEDRESGEKWISFREGGLKGLVEDVKYLTPPVVVYADSVNLLVKIQEMLEDSSAILHSQMPKSVWEENLDKLRSSNFVLMTSVGEVGVELEDYGIVPKSVVSVNTGSVSKVIQRLGRLARRKNSSGTFLNVDMPWVREEKRISKLFENGLSLGSPHLPSFLERARKFRGDFFTSYISPRADREFYRKIKEIQEGRRKFSVPRVYLSSCLSVSSLDNPDELVDFPVEKVASKVFPISADCLVRIMLDLEGRPVFKIVKRSKKDAGRPLIRLKVRSHRIDGSWSEVPAWLKEISVEKVEVSWDAEVMLELPLISSDHEKFRISGHTPLLRLLFKEGYVFGKNFAYTEEHEILMNNLYPASQDMSFLVPSSRQFGNEIVGIEPLSSESEGRYGVGAVEKALQIMGLTEG